VEFCGRSWGKAEMADLWTAKLDIYLDGELSASEMHDLDAHVRSCPGCAADVLRRVQLKRGLQAAGRRYTPSREFREGVLRQIAAPSRRSPARLWLTLTAAAAVLFAVGLVVTRVGQNRSERQRAFSEIADLHVATLASSNPVDVLSSDRHTVKPWFQGKIPFTFNLPELQNSEFTLIGGRITYLDQTAGAELIYQVRKHQISVFIFQDRALSPALRPESNPQRELSFTVESWSQDGLHYFVIGDAGAEDIAKLADLMKQAAR
jgi:anti-sigma factor RsiW